MRSNYDTTTVLRFLIIIVFIATSLFLISCSDDKNGDKDDGYYTCSMHPQVIQQEPGDCPICGMKLTFVPTDKKDESKEKKDGAHEGHKGHEQMEMTDKKSDKKNGTFKFSIRSELIQRANVYTVPAKKESFTRESDYSGHVDYNEDPNRLVVINTKYNGWIEKLYVTKEGQYIKKGQLLMGVYSQEILAAKEEYITTYQSLVNMYRAQDKDVADVLHDPILKASRKKLLYLDVPVDQIESMQETGEARRLTYYRSPIAGVVVKKNVVQGEFIKEGQELFRIADMSVLWVFFHVFEKDLDYIKKGQRVKITCKAYPDKSCSGRIDLIYPYLDMKTRDIKVRVVVNNRGRILKPGMYVKVAVESTIPQKVVTIPEQSIIYSGEKNYVFVSHGEGKFEVRPVVVLTRSDGRAVVKSGLKEKEMVVANGQFLLDSEASLKEAMEKGQMTGHQH